MSEPIANKARTMAWIMRNIRNYVNYDRARDPDETLHNKNKRRMIKNVDLYNSLAMPHGCVGVIDGELHLTTFQKHTNSIGGYEIVHNADFVWYINIVEKTWHLSKSRRNITPGGASYGVLAMDQ